MRAPLLGSSSFRFRMYCCSESDLPATQSRCIPFPGAPPPPAEPSAPGITETEESPRLWNAFCSKGICLIAEGLLMHSPGEWKLPQPAKTLQRPPLPSGEMAGGAGTDEADTRPCPARGGQTHTAHNATRIWSQHGPGFKYL